MRMWISTLRQNETIPWNKRMGRHGAIEYVLDYIRLVMASILEELFKSAIGVGYWSWTDLDGRTSHKSMMRI